MNIYDELSTLIPRKKRSPNGWLSFNAPCCVHNGEGVDTKRRGGLLQTEKGGVTYHCFNCGFKTGWVPGKPLGIRMQNLMRWLGATDDQITRIAFECLKTENDQSEKIIALPDFKPRSLPANSKLITEQSLYDDELVIPVVKYIYDRGLSLDDYNFYCSSEPGYTDRLIIPLSVDNKIVGYIARKITQGNPKYLTEHPPHVVFNLDKQSWDQEFILVFEGSIDALLLGGVAVLTNEISAEQALQINSTGKKIIVVPDIDEPGKKLIEHAINLGWSVSFPNWDEDVKDAADAVLKYGKLATMMSIIKNVESNSLKIKLKTKL